MKLSENRTLRTLLIVVPIVIIVIVAMVMMRMQSKVSLYKDPHTTGNTSCNLLNGGLFCEDEGKIYFANPNDDNALYVMDSDCKNIHLLSSDRVSYLNAAGDYLFYTRRNDQKAGTGDELLSLSKTGLFRLKKSGNNLGKLYDDPTQVLNLYGNYVYYQHYDQEKGLLLYVAKIDGSSDEVLLEEGVIPYVIEDDIIYYTGVKSDHQIHSMGVNGSNKQIILDGNFTSLTKQGDHLYFLDMERDYALCRMNIDGSEVETLVFDRVATYNVDAEESTLYYQIDDGKNNGLYAMDLESKDATLVSPGDYNYFHLTDNYLFYEDYQATRIFRMDLGTNEVSDFYPKKAKKK